MGQYLSFPATKKTTESGSNSRLFFALSEMQGWRAGMEDAHAAILDLDGNGEQSNAFFAVYDGHGGPATAKFAGQNVHKRLISEQSYADKNYEAALKRAFLGTDEDLLAIPVNPKTNIRDGSGCTAIAALVTPDNKIYVANAGDSRSVIGIKGEVKDLSFDHKPTNYSERTRINAAGGRVQGGRVDGNLALSRALGDFEYKKNKSLGPEAQMITANPDVRSHQITEEDEFLVLACDGIWDCLTSQQVIDYIRYHVSKGKELPEICEMLFEYCLAPDVEGNQIGCDNMSIIIVAITHGRTKKEWYKWVTKRVKSGHGYKTPSKSPELYSESRLRMFRQKREGFEARERLRAPKPEPPKYGVIGGMLTSARKKIGSWSNSWRTSVVSVLFIALLSLAFTFVYTTWARRYL
ncbi:hypothetical protein GALMADRAFT_237252 [Galerina marginata CBS 339.88]|uniref:protein-serine/threonine phosphatase n=1 Tax=Galerina marginata (strain CBS 339.88) TaxID=685588 RepID=A0A067TMF4_GALM3|nr:hypothetical protein GALMADRAFT_237252 [Galerina marginata CBS 339.88]